VLAQQPLGQLDSAQQHKEQTLIQTTNGERKQIIRNRIQNSINNNNDVDDDDDDDDNNNNNNNNFNGKYWAIAGLKLSVPPGVRSIDGPL